jgi:hypothetical protein
MHSPLSLHSFLSRQAWFPMRHWPAVVEVAAFVVEEASMAAACARATSVVAQFTLDVSVDTGSPGAATGIAQYPAGR